MHGVVEQQPDSITWPSSLSQQITRKLVSPCIQLTMSQGRVIGIHGKPAAVSHPVTQILDEVIETLTGSPPNRVLGVRPDHSVVSRHDPAECGINKVA